MGDFNNRNPEAMIYGFVFSDTAASTFGTASGTNLDAVNTTLGFDFKCVCTNPAGEIFSRALVNVTDNGILAEDFGGISGGLANGVEVFAEDTDGSVLLDYLNGETIKTNGDWTFLAGVDVARDTEGAGDDRLIVRWTLEKAGRPQLFKQGQALVFRVNDNISSITRLKIMIQGYNAI